MACSYPIKIRDPVKGTDINPKFLLVPCGKCIACVQRKRSEWSFRLLQELKISNKATFLTLTYSDLNVTKDLKLQKKDLQDYFKRVRSKNPNVKYYAVGEYGGTSLRPHYHAIVFNTDNELLIDKWARSNNSKNNSKIPIGFVTTDPVNEATIHYVTGYVVSKYGKMDEKTGKMLPDIRVNEQTGEIQNWSSGDLRPFAIMSKGLGKIYLKHNAKFHKRNFTTTTKKEGGIIQNLPRYYRDKIFNESERKELSKLNQIKQKEAFLGNSAEFEKRQYNKLIVKNQLKKKKI